MLLGGLWHGASLRFVIWGALHGLALSFHKSFKELFPEKKERKNSFLSAIVTFIAVVVTFHFVAFCWIFFRSKDFSTAMTLIGQIGQLSYDPHQWWVIIEGYQNIIILLVVGYVWHFFPYRWNEALRLFFGKIPLVGKALVLAVVFWLVYATASAGPQPFIYFQF